MLSLQTPPVETLRRFVAGQAAHDFSYAAGAIFVAAGLLTLAPMAGLVAALFSFARAWRRRSS